MNEHVAVVALDPKSCEIVELVICYAPNAEFVKNGITEIRWPERELDLKVVEPSLHWSSVIVHPQVDADYDTKGG